MLFHPKSVWHHIFRLMFHSRALCSAILHGLSAFSCSSPTKSVDGHISLPTTRWSPGWHGLPASLYLGHHVNHFLPGYKNKVNRCLARYSPRHNHQPTHQQGTKWACNGQKKANFGPNWVVFGQKIFFFTGEIKSFVTHITENPPRHLVRIGFWSGMGRNGQKMAIFGPKWPKMHILDQFRPFLSQKS